MKVSVAIACLVVAGFSLHRASFGESAPAPQVSIEVTIVTGEGREPRFTPTQGKEPLPANAGALRYARRWAEEASQPGEYPAEVSRYVALRGPLNQRLSAIVSNPISVIIAQEKDGKKQLVESELHIGTTLSVLAVAKNDEVAVSLSLQDTEQAEDIVINDDQTVPSVRSQSMNSVVRLKSGETKNIGRMNGFRIEGNEKKPTWKVVLLSARLITDAKAANSP